MKKFISWTNKNKVLLSIVAVLAAFIIISIYYSEMHKLNQLIGGWVANFIISWLFYNFSVKKEIAEAVEKTKKDVEKSLNEQFTQYLENLSKVRDKSQETLLRKYKINLENQLKADMAEIFGVKPGSNTSANKSQIRPLITDSKYDEMFCVISERSEKLLNLILNDKSN